MYELNDLLLILKSTQPIINIQTHEERRAINLVHACGMRLNKQILQWSVTQGLVNTSSGNKELSLVARGRELSAEDRANPKLILQEIAKSKTPGLYILLDFHPYLEDAYIVRMLKEIAQDQLVSGHHLVFISAELQMPPELSRLTAQFSLSLPDREKLRKLVASELQIWQKREGNESSRHDPEAMELLVNNLSGLTVSESQRLIRNAIYDDEAITASDIDRVQKAKYELLGKEGILSFEYETAKFDQVGGLSKLKRWLGLRKEIFLAPKGDSKLDKPKGILLVGIQGSGKSLAAKAVAGAWGVPLLRLDFGALYNKFFGESEKNIRHALALAEVMSPCVLWIDEIEKGISTGDYDSGTSQRILATLLTWMAENSAAVFLVATANNIQALPPELIRKGRLDEIFFVDLPDAETRNEIFRIHLEKRGIKVRGLESTSLIEQTAGFSGAEIEQVVVSALYNAHAQNEKLSLAMLLAETEQTQPLATVMREDIEQLQRWAQERTVMAH